MEPAAFVAKWAESSASERANKDAFLLELCDVLGVPRPDAATGDRERDQYVFERDAVMSHEGGKLTVGKIDLYKEGCFLLEAKQGSEAGDRRLGTARRNTPAWNIAMRDAFGQALGYARTFDQPPPFLVVCDIGHCFDLYSAFDGSGDYRPFPDAQSSRLHLADLAKHVELLRAVFVAPLSLDPSTRAAKVTREVAAHLADLARELEDAGHSPELVAKFLMRCLFTMFAEDVGLLPERIFTDALEQEWLPNPEKFPLGMQNLWAAMNEGLFFGFAGRLLRFNGGLFSEQNTLPLTKRHLELLLEAARCNWAEVEPAIFGTLLERALDARERHALGAHYTPRAYVERLVKPTIEEPIRAEWAIVQAEARQLVNAGKVKQADKVVRSFHDRLCRIRVLDPACGSGNFLYVTLDLFKRLEDEVLKFVADLSDSTMMLEGDAITVTPAQFHGIEIKRWAKEITELVLWIGYLQWHHRTHGQVPPREPVLQDYRNIECRDAVLAYDRDEVVRDEQTLKPLTRWDGHTMKKSPITGEDVPDESAHGLVMRYVNPRRATWPDADFIIGNPPFVGNKRMRAVLGDGYVEALRAAHDDVSETSDYVMYWWNHAAELVGAGKVRRFGLITTNSITQTFNRKVVQKHLDEKGRISIVFAVPDHPWVDSEGGAQVRIAMTVGVGVRTPGLLLEVTSERDGSDAGSEFEIRGRSGTINSDLTVGLDLAPLVRLTSNRGLSCPGIQLSGQGFVLRAGDVESFSSRTREELIKPYLTGRDLTQVPRTQFVIDTYGLTEDSLRRQFPDAYQWLVNRVRPERMQNPREKYKRDWWLHSETRAKFRNALMLRRFIGTSRTARHRVFQFIDGRALAETKILVIALEDSFHLGVLSSSVHVQFAKRSGGWLGVGNDSTYNHTDCFDPFPFPKCTEIQISRIRELGELLESHRRRQQAQYADLTITGMYNVLEKLRGDQALTAKEKRIHEQGLVSVLKQIQNDLDAAVLDAYGWPHDLTDEQILERLVGLNAERAEEERCGLVRWLRPEFQNPSGAKLETQVQILEGQGVEAGAAVPAQKVAWPKKLPAQIAAVRDLMLHSDASWTVEQAASSFKGARRTDVEAALESLAALGVVLSYLEGPSRQWRRVGRAAA